MEFAFDIVIFRKEMNNNNNFYIDLGSLNSNVSCYWMFVFDDYFYT